MLKTRIVTAVLLLAVFLVALLCFPASGWCLFATLVAALAAWEWGALMALGKGGRVALGVVFSLVCLAIAGAEPAALGLTDGFASTAWRLGRWFYVPAAAFWLLAVPLWMRYRWPLPKSLCGALIGLLLILPTWLAFVQLRQGGAAFLFAVMATVWLADIGAYLFGRTLGRHKLAPSISPGKTWEGALGGALVIVAYGFVLAPSMPDTLANNSLLLFVVLLLVAAISVVGDLFESLLKRQAGLKDSSAILPGHGGILDRIDSLTSTLPLVALVWLSSHPGAGS